MTKRNEYRIQIEAQICLSVVAETEEEAKRLAAEQIDQSSVGVDGLPIHDSFYVEQDHLPQRQDIIVYAWGKGALEKDEIAIMDVEDWEEEEVLHS